MQLPDWPISVLVIVLVSTAVKNTHMKLRSCCCCWVLLFGLIPAGVCCRLHWPHWSLRGTAPMKTWPKLKSRDGLKNAFLSFLDRILGHILHLLNNISPPTNTNYVFFLLRFIMMCPLINVQIKFLLVLCPACLPRLIWKYIMIEKLDTLIILFYLGYNQKHSL